MRLPRLLDLVLALASVVTTFVIFEVGLRVADFSYVSFYRPDDHLGLRLRENAEGWFSSEGRAFIRINSAGFHDRERVIEKPDNVFRIAVLGDSYAEALSLDLDRTFHVLLEHRLNACNAARGKSVEVLNFGVSGYGTAQELLTYRHIASKYSPDLVLLALFTGNDIRNNSRDLEPEKMRPFFVLRGDSLVEDRSFADSAEFKRRMNRLRAVLDRLRVLRVVQAAYFVKDRLQMSAEAPKLGHGVAAFEAGLDDAVYSEPKSPQWRDAWTVTDRLLGQMRDEVQGAGADFLVVTLSAGIQVHPDPTERVKFMSARGVTDILYPDRRIERAAAAIGVRTILLAPRFQEIAERDKVFLHGFPNTRLGTGHWNEKGHMLAADMVAGELCRGSAQEPR